MTEEQYQRLLPHKGAIQSRAASGETANAIIALYREISGDSNFRVGCKACMEEMINYMNAVIQKYERELMP